MSQHEKSTLPPPQCKSLLLCEKTIRDGRTGKPSLINVFNAFVLESYPAHTPTSFLFAQLTGALGPCQLRAHVLDLHRDAIVLQSALMDVHFPDKLAMMDVIVEIPPMPIPHPGLYDLVLLADGQEIQRLQFLVHRRPGPPRVPQGPIDELL